MAWVKLEDTFAEHPKVQAAGDDAAWLYVSGLLYCSRALTDGFIPAPKVGQLTSLKRPWQAAHKLVEVDLWEEVDGGYRVHDYLEHQQSAANRKRERQKAAERQSRRRNADVTPESRRDISDVTAQSRVAEVEVEREVEGEVGGLTTNPPSSDDRSEVRQAASFENFKKVGGPVQSVVENLRGAA